jgi:polyphenol oxidase
MLIESRVPNTDIAFSYFDDFPVEHYFFQRTGGLSEQKFTSLNTAIKSEDPNTSKNRKLLLEKLLAFNSKTTCTAPTHSDLFHIVSETNQCQEEPLLITGFDALFCKSNEQSLYFSTADCLPILLSSSTGRETALIHLGWRNLFRGDFNKFLALFCSELKLSKSQISIALGPHIRLCCYKFPEVSQRHDPEWAQFFQLNSCGNYRIDLTGALLYQISLLEIEQSKIFVHPHCTCCHQEKYFSNFRDGQKSGRFGTFIRQRRNAQRQYE